MMHMFTPYVFPKLGRSVVKASNANLELLPASLLVGDRVGHSFNCFPQIRNHAQRRHGVADLLETFWIDPSIHLWLHQSQGGQNDSKPHLLKSHGYSENQTFALNQLFFSGTTTAVRLLAFVDLTSFYAKLRVSSLTRMADGRSRWPMAGDDIF